MNRREGALGEDKTCSQNDWVFGLCPSSSILKTREHNVSETDLFPCSGEGGDTYSVGSLRKS
jgi:hypothetical protein